MSAFLMVILVCGMGTSPEACTRDSALDVIVRGASGPLECMLSSQPTVATTELGRDGTYTKTMCERRPA
jgi:hypothetical protein